MTRHVMSLFFVSMLLAGLVGQADAQQDKTSSAAYKATLLAHKQSTAPRIVERMSTFFHCLGGNDTRVHDLGFLQANSKVGIRFQSDFDPVALVLALQLGQDAPGEAVSNASTFVDDDTGGDLEPELHIVAPFDGSYSLHVSDGAAELPLEGGCYVYELAVELPAVTATAR